jgi:NADH dehydrogenase
VIVISVTEHADRASRPQRPRILARIPTKEGSFAPPTAQHAIRQAKTAAHNIVAAIRGGSKTEFAFGGLGKMGALGHHSAVAEIMGINISGFLAWWMWRTIYLMKLPGWGRRLKVATSWTLDLLLPADLVELKLSGSQGISQQHFEPAKRSFIKVASEIECTSQ